MTEVKICGLTRVTDVHAAVQAGADYLGLTFFPASKRAITLDQATVLLAEIPSHVTKTALVVDPDDALLDQLVGLGFELLQLHGQEPPNRVADVRARTGLPVMKAIGIRTEDDVPLIDLYAPVADRLMIDAKPPEGDPVPGGHGVAFDWRLIAGRTWTRPWMLAGGLTPDNVADAVRLTGTPTADVASGVESSPGIKDHAKIKAFVAAAKGIDAAQCA